MASPLINRLKTFKKKCVISAIVLALSLLFAVLAGRLSAQEAADYNSPTAKFIRVQVLDEAGSFPLRVNGPYEIIDPLSNNILERQKSLKTTVTSSKKGIFLGGKNFEFQKLLIKPVGEEGVLLNARRFRGDIYIIKKKNSKLSAVNLIEVENYIKGILYNEASHYWPLEALKAQAVACRTFALYQIEQNSAKDYDVTSDIYSQVYGGKASERYRTSRAVNETAGEVLTFKGKIFAAYYHATCAGHTEDASLLWDNDIAPLKGVPCFFCKESPHFKWHQVLLLDKISSKLSASGQKIKDIQKIEALEKDRSGRILNLRITSADKTINIPAKDFRNIIGPNVIRSTNFSIEIADGDAVFEGLGWGHGVGLCQWGAYFMAKRGYDHKRILEYYYPQAVISKMQ
ncbi:MAG: SpoIID/LytB domain-containing protein [Candidatus Omnitrophica bacterium]|nr:SpoIID/LytB domain-containing protein [Candidatus Omnitrophota bacterium]